MNTKPNPIQITTSRSFDDRIDILFRELELAIRWKRPSILLAICKSENTHHEVESILKKRLLALGQDVHSFKIDEVEQADVPQYLTNLPHLEQKVVFMEGFSLGGSKRNKHAFKALNSGRDYFINRQLRVVFWLSSEEANELAHHAPEFWGYRHRVVEFMENMDANHSPLRSLSSIWQGIGEFSDAHDDIDNKIALRDSLLAELPNKSESTSSRANLLISLGVLHFRKGDVHKAISYSQTAIKLATKIEDKWFEAMCKNTLALIQANTGKVSEAIDTLKQATDLAPNLIFPWNNMGNLLNELDRLDEAMEAFHAAMQFNAEDPLSLNGLGNTYFKLGRTDDAYKNYQQAIQVAPSFAHAWNGLGNIFTKVEQIESAISAFQKAIELDNHMATPWINLGSIFEKLNRNDEAAEAFRKAYELDPSNSIVWMEQGKIYFNTGCMDEAVCAFQKSIDLDHGNGWSYCNLAQTYVCKGKYSEAIQLYHQSLKLFTSDTDKAVTWSKLAKVYQQKNDLENAINAKMIALELDPDNEQLKKELFEIHNSLKDKTINRNESAGYLEPVNTLDIPGFIKDSRLEPASTLPKSSKSVVPVSMNGKADGSKNLETAFEWNEYGNALLKAGSLEEARQAYNKAIEKDAQFGWAFGNLALIEFNKGNYSEAADGYQKCIKLLKTRKEKVVVLNRLGTTYRKTNDFLRAIQTHRKALDLIPGDISTWQNLIQIHNDLGKLRSGIEMLTPSLDKASAWNLLGNAYRRLSDYTSALEVLKKASDMSPSDNAYKFDLEETKRESRKKVSTIGTKENESNPIDIDRIKKSLGKSEQAAFVDRGEPGPLGELVSLAADKDMTAQTEPVYVETELEPRTALKVPVKDSNQQDRLTQSPSSQIAGAKYRNMWHLEENLNPSEEKRIALPIESLNPALLIHHRAAELVSAQFGGGGFVDDMVPAEISVEPATVSAPYVITSRHPKSINFFLGKNAQRSASYQPTGKQTSTETDFPKPIRKVTHVEAPNEKVESGRYQKDIDTYKTVTRINPKNGRAWFTLGKFQWAAGQNEGATASFEKAVELDPQQEVYQYQLGVLYARQFRYEDAVESLKKVVGITPGYSLAHAHLATYYKKLGKSKESQIHQEIANESIQNEDDYNQACFASILGNSDKAVELLKKALKESQTSRDWINMDHDFDGIRTEENFKIMMAG